MPLQVGSFTVTAYIWNVTFTPRTQRKNPFPYLRNYLLRQILGDYFEMPREFLLCSFLGHSVVVLVPRGALY